jgi:hypothetical protein
MQFFPLASVCEAVFILANNYFPLPPELLLPLFADENEGLPYEKAL